jgi:uncharacterized protein (UPF0262 family)
MTDERIAAITLDEGSIIKRSVEVEHERKTALADLLHENSFAPHCLNAGPYTLSLSVRDGRLAFDIQSQSSDKNTQLVLSVQPLKTIIRDYFMICESYYATLKSTACGKVEAIDMGRKALHNEGAEMLQELLKGRISLDFPTARRLFTLICVLHIR